MMRNMWHKLTVLIILAGLVAAAPVMPAKAAGTVGDGTPGSCTETALDTALTGGGLVTFNCGPAPHTIPLTTEKSLSFDTQIDGGELITLDGQDQTRIFYVPGGVTLELSNITLTRGNGEGAVSPDWGGAIQIDGGSATITNSLLTANTVGDFEDGGAIDVRASGGELTVIASTLTDNVGGRGGAIFAEGATATVIDSVINGNTSAENGGGIYARNIVTISGTTISNNDAGFIRSGDGGGIYNQGDLTLTDSTISGNEAEDEGGGIFDTGESMTISGTTIHDNHAGEVSANGGGIRSNSPLILIDSTISDNTSDDDGAGLYIRTSTATITGTTISGNQSNDGRGGGIHNSGTTVLTDSTVSGNQSTESGGGIYNSNALTIINSTISGNQTNEDGGGIRNTGGTLTVTNSTISDNSAVLDGDGIRWTSGPVTLQNTIIANSPDDNCSNSTGSPFNSLGGNLSDDDTCGFTAPSDLNDTEADLGPLADNGGPTRTHLPQSGSPAIDHTACVVATDQRGVSRPQGPGCDIGAVEVIQGATYLLCASYYTGNVTSPLSGDCGPGTSEITPFDKSFCLNSWTGQVQYLFGRACTAPRFAHTMPDDGDLLTCVSLYTGANRWVMNHSQCGAYDVPNTIPAAP